MVAMVHLTTRREAQSLGTDSQRLPTVKNRALPTKLQWHCEGAVTLYNMSYAQRRWQALVAIQQP
jgi:ABC-type uncharacterized transport system YnjBCD substrate-binding protein